MLNLAKNERLNGMKLLLNFLSVLIKFSLERPNNAENNGIII